MSEEKMNQKDLVAKTFNNDAIAEYKINQLNQFDGPLSRNY